MRRLDLKPEKRLRNPDRHLRALRRWADGFAGAFPVDAVRETDQRFLSWRMPVFSKLVSEPHTTPAILSACIQCLVDAVTHLYRDRPAECAAMPVAALITYPHLFWSEVTIFVDPAYFGGFDPDRVVFSSTAVETLRISAEPPRTNFIEEFAIDLPPGCQAGGYHLTEIDLEDPELSRESEQWTVGYW